MRSSVLLNLPENTHAILLGLKARMNGCAVVNGRATLHFRGLLRHDHVNLQTQYLSSQGKRLSMIARALGHYSAGSTRDMDAR